MYRSSEGTGLAKGFESSRLLATNITLRVLGLLPSHHLSVKSWLAPNKYVPVELQGLPTSHPVSFTGVVLALSLLVRDLAKWVCLLVNVRRFQCGPFVQEGDGGEDNED